MINIFFKSKILFFLIVFQYGILNAQESINAAGGEASGSGGSAAYSFGQVVYTSNTSSNGTLEQGVQHAYEIYTVGIKETAMNISLSVFPNPTFGNLELKVGNEHLDDLNFVLYDALGKLIESKKITTTTETFSMDHLPGATYFLSVRKHNTELKSFKIIKY
jgi:hypothetical protein